MAPHIMTGVALITGAASGIGRACALTFADEGVTRLILADINTSGLQETSDLLTKLNPEVQALVIKTDTSSESDVQKMVDAAVKKFGSIQYAVNCAGVTSEPRAKSADLSVEAWDRVMNINIRGVWLCQRAVIRQMLRQEYLPADQMRSGAAPERGSIVNISSVLGRSAHPTNGSVRVMLSTIIHLH
jgi:NAD(P)-dependent dehydrogenase (short-subunit alcohol dehydrogenase family)